MTKKNNIGSGLDMLPGQGERQTMNLNDWEEHSPSPEDCAEVIRQAEPAFRRLQAVGMDLAADYSPPQGEQ